MMGQSELRIKHDTEVAHRRRDGYVRDERREPLKVNLYKYPAATKRDGLSLRGIEKEAVCSYPRSECVNRLTHLS